MCAMGSGEIVELLPFTQLRIACDGSGVRRQRNPDFGASDLRETFQLIRLMVMRPCDDGVQCPLPTGIIRPNNISRPKA
jgi:hypothetical protein